MKLRKARLFLAGLVFLLAPTILFSLALALDVPPLRGRINDYAGLIPADRARALEERLARFEAETGHQIAVLTIPSLKGDSLEDFSIRVAEAWKIGKKGFDNGAILLIARDDRKLRIEVGYGLEGVMPDAIASRIIREVITPRFRSGDYAGGIEAGVDAILKITKGEALPERTRPAPGPTTSQGAVANNDPHDHRHACSFYWHDATQIIGRRCWRSGFWASHFIVRFRRAWICFAPSSHCRSPARSHRRCSGYRICGKSMGR